MHSVGAKVENVWKLYLSVVFQIIISQYACKARFAINIAQTPSRSRLEVTGSRRDVHQFFADTTCSEAWSGPPSFGVTLGKKEQLAEAYRVFYLSGYCAQRVTVIAVSI